MELILFGRELFAEVMGLELSFMKFLLEGASEPSLLN